MSDQITYDDKTDLIVDTTIDNIFKVTASDMNEIKNVVNGNAEEVGDITSLTTTDKTSVVNAVNELNAPEKWVSVGTTAPENGERVWFKKSKNLINYADFTGSITDYYFVSLPSTNFALEAGKTYTLSLNVNSSVTPFAISVGAGQSAYAVDIKQTDSHQNGRNSITFTPTETQLANGNILFFRVPRYGTPQSSVTFNISDVQLEEGSTATSYEPYVEPSINVDDEEWFKKIQFEDVTSKVSVSVQGGSISASDVGSINAQKFYHIAPHIYIGNIVFTNITSHYNNDQMQILFKVSGIGTILRCVGSGGNYDRQFASIFDDANNNVYAYIQKGANASTSNFNATYRCIFITQEE